MVLERLVSTILTAVKTPDRATGIGTLIISGETKGISIALIAFSDDSENSSSFCSFMFNPLMRQFYIAQNSVSTTNFLMRCRLFLRRVCFHLQLLVYYCLIAQNSVDLFVQKNDINAGSCCFICVLIFVMTFLLAERIYKKPSMKSNDGLGVYSAHQPPNFQPYNANSCFNFASRHILNT
jgi:hypothetical protein